MSKKTCCITGHRTIPTHKIAYVKTKLKEELEKAIADGFTTFVSGMAKGVDLLFAELVIAQKALHPELILIAAIPYGNRLNTSDPLFLKCLERCDDIYIQQAEYSGDCFMGRNRYMVAKSSRVIAVYDGRERGGTLFTMGYARKMQRDVREIRL